MTQPVENTFVRRLSVQYDGTNGDAILAAARSCGSDAISWTIDPDDGDALKLRVSHGGNQFYVYTIPLGYWAVMVGEDAAIQVFSDVTYPRAYSNVNTLWPELRAAHRLAVDQSFTATLPSPYFGMGVGSSASSIGIGATVNIDARVRPPVPAGPVTIGSEIILTTGVTLGTVAVTATPVVTLGFVPASLVGGVIVPAHSIVRTKVKNTGLSVLAGVQILTTVHA